jgi:site-specific DNA recombinase
MGTRARVRDLKGQRVAVYARFSTDKQNPRSIEDQLRVCREHVERMGGALANDLIFTDAGISGSSIIRPGFQALHEAVRARRIDVIITEDLSRIGRDIANNAAVLKQFGSLGARLLAINDGIDTGQQGSKLLGAIKSAMAENYLDELRDRTRRGMDGLFEAGMSTGGKTFGYANVPQPDGRARMEIDATEAAIVRQIFERYLAGHSIRAIAEHLNQDGERAPRGGKWNNLTVRAMLRNEVYAGSVIYNRRQWIRDSETGKRRYVERPRSEWRKQERPELRIIDAGTWHEAATRISAIAKRYKQGQRKTSSFPLSGLLACGACGALLTINGSGKRYYLCSAHQTGRGCANNNSIAEPRIRTSLITKIQEAAGDKLLLDDLRAQWAARVGEQSREVRSELERRRAALATIQNQISRLLDYIADGNDSPSTAAKIKEKEDHADLQRATIARLESVARHVPTIPSAAVLRAFLASLPEAVLNEPVETREALRHMLKGPVVCYPPQTRRGPFRVRFELDLDELANVATQPGNSKRVTTFDFASCGGAVLAKSNTRTAEYVCAATGTGL